MEKIEDLEKATDDELALEQIRCEKLWSRFSCDCFGFYISALHREITKRNIWLKVHGYNRTSELPSTETTK